MIEVRKITFNKLCQAPNIAQLTQEYAQEASIEEMPQHNPQIDMYLAMESTGIFHVFGAYDGDEMVGFLNMLTTKLPHYGVHAGTIESFFVEHSHRKTGAGRRLLSVAEDFAKSVGCIAMLLSAPTGSRLAKIMPRTKYRKSNEIFCRRLG